MDFLQKTAFGYLLFPENGENYQKLETDKERK